MKKYVLFPEGDFTYYVISFSNVSHDIYITDKKTMAETALFQSKFRVNFIFVGEIEISYSTQASKSQAIRLFVQQHHVFVDIKENTNGSHYNLM